MKLTIFVQLQKTIVISYLVETLDADPLTYEKISYTVMKSFLKMPCASSILIWNLTNLPIQKLMGK